MSDVGPEGDDPSWGSTIGDEGALAQSVLDSTIDDIFADRSSAGLNSREMDQGTDNAGSNLST
jgi:hypothetical protein